MTVANTNHLTDLEQRILRGLNDPLSVASEWLDEMIRKCPRRQREWMGVYRVIAAQASKGRLIVVDKSTHVNTGGGDITGSAFGQSVVDAQTIQNIKGRIDSSANIDSRGQAVFKNAVDELASQQWDEELKTEALGELEKLRAQVDKGNPSEGMLKKCWGAITALASGLPEIGKLGQWLGSQFPGLFS